MFPAKMRVKVAVSTLGLVFVAAVLVRFAMAFSHYKTPDTSVVIFQTTSR